MSMIAEQEPTVEWREVAVLLWPLTREVRDQLHGPHTGCPTRRIPYSERDPDARWLSATCRAAGCLDHLHELLLATMNRLEHTDLSTVQDLPRFVSRVARNQLVELRRHERVAAGYPAKPTRTDGIPGRVCLALSSVADPASRSWFPVLFRILRAYPFAPGRTTATWPLDGLTAEKSGMDGRPRLIASRQARQEIADDIHAVLAIAEQVAGRDWVYDNITSPLLAYRTMTELTDAL